MAAVLIIPTFCRGVENLFCRLLEQNGKHHYYEHARKLAKDGISHPKRCRLERIRAERTEKMVLGFLKEVLAKPEMIDAMVTAYYNQTSTELPRIVGRLKSIDAEVKQHERRVENLVTRLSELPSDLSAEPIYGQLKALNEKITTLKVSRVNLEAEKNQVSNHAIDQEALKEWIKAAVGALENCPASKQRPIFANVIQFAEIYPTKVRLGLYAPLASRARSTSVHQTARRET